MTNGAGEKAMWLKWARYGAGACLAAVCVSVYVWRASVREPVFELYVFDTPGAPSLFVRTPDDRRILVNGGSNSDIVARLTRLLPFYSRRIDEIIATDDDPKHITGLIEALQRYDIGSVSVGVASSSDPTYAVFLQTMAGKQLKPDLLSAGAYIGETPLKLVESKRAIFSLEAGGEVVLIVPFNPSGLSKKLMNSIKPGYLIYSAAVTGKVQRPRPPALAGMMDDRRFNIRATGTVRVSIKKAPEGAHLNIEQM